MTETGAQSLRWDYVEEAAAVDEPTTRELQFGEKAVTWGDVQGYLYRLPNENGYSLPGDDDAYMMNRLRGLVMVQAAETEGVLGQVLLELNPDANPSRLMAHKVLVEVWGHLSPSDRRRWSAHMTVIRRAQKKRNKVVHERVTIGSVWRDYATGDGGEWVPVISFLGDTDYAEHDLRRDLALQQAATVLALEILHSLKCGDHDLEEECSTWW